jgi:hypothetical protein
MAHFELLLEKTRFAQIGRGRLFLTGNSGVEAAFIVVGGSIDLTMVGVPARSSPAITQVVIPASSGPLGLMMPVGAAPPSDIVSVTTRGNRATITAVKAGSCAVQIGGGSPLFVLAGSFQNHTDMEHDLIADVYRSADPEKMHALNRMLFNNDDNLFNENSPANIKQWGKLACGTVSKVGGNAVFYGALEYDMNDYYRAPIAGRTRADIIMVKDKLDKGRAAIKARLAKGRPAIVGLIYADSAIQNKRVNVNGTGGHTLLIVGCDKKAEKFLYIDVYKTGSNMTYKGGYTAPKLFPDPCDGIGMFELTTDAKRGEILRSTTPGVLFSGSQVLEVMSGPVR